MPPPVPNAFNNRYELQTDHAVFCGEFGWARGGGGSNRILRLLAMDDAPYSTPADRQAAHDPARIQQAIDYLFATATGLPRPNGILRYRPSNGTFCNIFVNDVTRILNVEIPNNPAITFVGQMRRWLDQNAAANGWQELPGTEGMQAQDAANHGRVAVMMWSKDQTSDHIALVRPGQAKVDAHGRVWPRIAQAGLVVIADRDSQQSFGQLSADALRYYLHD